MRDGDARTAFAQAIAWLKEGRGVAFEFDEPPFNFDIIPYDFDGRARWVLGGSVTYRADLIEIGTCDGPKGPQFRIYSSKGPEGAEEPVDGHILGGRHLVSVRRVRDEPIATIPRLDFTPESLEAVWTAMRELEYRISVALDDKGLELTPEQQRALRRLKNGVSNFSWDGVGGPQYSEGGQ